MNPKQIIAILMPFVLLGIMFPTFRWLARKLGNAGGWFAGLLLFWVVWGAAFPLAILGKETILALIRPQAFDLGAVLLVAVPILFAGIGRLFMGVEYQKPNAWALAAVLTTAFGNGLFEEILWRGTFLVLFPDSIFFSIFYSSLWFALWHYAPRSVSPGAGNGSSHGFVVGAFFFGLLLSFLAFQTDTIWWTILAHTLAGIVMVI